MPPERAAGGDEGGSRFGGVSPLNISPPAPTLPRPPRMGMCWCRGQWRHPCPASPHLPPLRPGGCVSPPPLKLTWEPQGLPPGPHEAPKQLHGAGRRRRPARGSASGRRSGVHPLSTPSSHRGGRAKPPPPLPPPGWLFHRGGGGSTSFLKPHPGSRPPAKALVKRAKFRSCAGGNFFPPPRRTRSPRPPPAPASPSRNAMPSVIEEQS